MSDVIKIEPEKKRGGRWVVIGEEQYKIPPLAFGDIRELMADVESLRSMSEHPTPDQMKVVTTLVWKALARNYPSMSLKDVDDMLDFGNFYEVLGAVLSVSGFVKKEDPASGEAASSIGTESMSS